MILSELHQWIHSTLITITMLGCPPCHHSAIFRNYLLAWNRSSLTESIIVITKLEKFLLTGPTDELKNDWFSQEIHLFALIGCTRTPIINIFDSRDFIKGSLSWHFKQVQGTAKCIPPYWYSRFFPIQISAPLSCVILE